MRTFRRLLNNLFGRTEPYDLVEVGGVNWFQINLPE